MKEEGILVGKITHFFGKINVAVIEITDNNLKNGDTILVKGNATEFEQEVDSMQVDHNAIEEAIVGTKVGLKLKEAAKVGDLVYKK